MYVKYVKLVFPVCVEFHKQNLLKYIFFRRLEVESRKYEFLRSRYLYFACSHCVCLQWQNSVYSDNTVHTTLCGKKSIHIITTELKSHWKPFTVW